MKITRVSTTAVRLPIPPRSYASDNAGTKREWGRLSRLSPKRPSTILEYLLVRIDTDQGTAGIGEAPVDIGFFGQTLEEVQAAIDDYLGPQIVGLDPFDREYAMHRIDYRGSSCAKSGIDLALHDLMGRTLGVPVSQLIGGSHRKRIPVAIEVAGGAPADMAKACLAYMDKGVRAFKPKIGAYPQEDVERLRAIREAVGPDVSLRADANQGYTPKEAIRLCRLAEKHHVGLELLEQPVPAWDLQGMAAVRSAVDTLIEADESCYTIHDAMQIIRHGAADVLNIKIAKAGGLYGAKKIAALAEAAGLGCVLGTGFGLGVKIAAKLHLAASTMLVTDAVEFTELGLHDNLLASPGNAALALPLDDGCLPVPDGPGFGVELDEAKVAQHAGHARN
ncbi:MAG: dipeptide epimerase [Candidatus Brocadiae bacterium]|nr:dipeptide epimerase [Candidatus Brocadiia bacterium]